MASIQEAANLKPLFFIMYLTVMIGILFWSFYLFSAIYSASSRQFSVFGFPSLVHKLNTSFLGTVNDMLAPDPKPLENMVRPFREVPPSGSKMPPLEDFRLTKELVQRRVKDNVIILTFGNYAFMDFILNWVKHLTDLHLENFLVGAMDSKLLEALYWKGLPVFDMGSKMSTEDVGCGSGEFHKMGREKAILIDAILPYGYELLMCDTDMVWLKNPLPYIARYPGADILTSSDQVEPTVVDDRLEIWQQVGAAYNVGIFHWRPTDSSKKLAKNWKEMLLANDKIWDQDGFNDLVRRQLGPSIDEESGLTYAYDGKLKLGILPASIFCSGHTYFIQAMYQQLRLEPYAVHTTFQYSGTAGKRHRLREAMVFYDPPVYYDPPGGFITFKPLIPKRLLLNGEHNVTSHFSLVHYQLKQIRTALAVALVLNRTLVMPPLWCRLDRLWHPHPGILKGSMTRQPFICPLDHAFAVSDMVIDMPEKIFGPQIRIREYSLFENPLTPVQVKESWLDVKLCRNGSEGCGVTDSTGPPRVLRFPKKSSEEKFKEVFSSYQNIKVIQFLSMQDAFTGFSNKTTERLFRARVTRYVTRWCCLNINHTKLSHIYYDMYWDEKPGSKPVPPKTLADDSPPWKN